MGGYLLASRVPQNRSSTRKSNTRQCHQRVFARKIQVRPRGKEVVFYFKKKSIFRFDSSRFCMFDSLEFAFKKKFSRYGVWLICSMHPMLLIYTSNAWAHWLQLRLSCISLFFITSTLVHLTDWMSIHPRSFSSSILSICLSRTISFCLVFIFPCSSLLFSPFAYL